MKTIASRLEHLLEKYNISQTELATRAGISQPTIWKILAGRSKKSRELPAIARALGVNLNWLVDGVGTITGNDEGLEALDASKLIRVYEGNEATGRVITSPVRKSEPSWRAYELKSDSMVNVAPTGSIVVVDQAIRPGMNDYVVAHLNGKDSVWRFKESPMDENGLLQSDDPAIPPFSPPESAIIGVVIYIICEFKRS